MNLWSSDVQFCIVGPVDSFPLGVMLTTILTWASQPLTEISLLSFTIVGQHPITSDKSAPGTEWSILRLVETVKLQLFTVDRVTGYY